MTKNRLPAEWEPQSAVQLTWPHPQTDWADDLPQAFAVFVEIGAAIASRQTLLSICPDDAQQQQIENALMAAGANPRNLRFAQLPSDDTWARDHGPITTLNGEQALLHDFVFDGWGKKFDASLDNQLSKRLHDAGHFARVPMRHHALVLEGGAIETDGHGTLLATRSSVLDSVRNPGSTLEDIEQLLGEELGIERFLWLDHGRLSGDDTDAHIDVLARFCDPHNIVISTAPSESPDHASLQRMAEQLSTFSAFDGRALKIHKLPWPGAHYDPSGRLLPASYANFLIINQAVLMPTYSVPADAEAIGMLQGLFPGREVCGIDCRPIIAQNGSLHCLTMQYPQAVDIR